MSNTDKNTIKANAEISNRIIGVDGYKPIEIPEEQREENLKRVREQAKKAKEYRDSEKEARSTDTPETDASICINPISPTRAIQPIKSVLSIIASQEGNDDEEHEVMQKASEYIDQLERERDEANRQLEWLWANCKIVHFPKDQNLGRYYEHAPLANKDMRSAIEQAMGKDRQER